MKIYIEEELAKVEEEMIQHFKDYNIEKFYESIYLSEKDYFPENDIIEYDEEFSKWFYYFQGQYHKLQDILKFLNG